jgi:HEAT repeat protein
MHRLRYTYLRAASLNIKNVKTMSAIGIGCAGHSHRNLPLFAALILLTAASAATSAQVGPLAPRWLAGTPPPPVETFADGLARHHIPTTETALIAALKDSDGEVRSLAAAELAAMDDHPALPAISRAVDDERDPQVLVNLAGAASWLGSRHALDQLQQVCQNTNMPSVVRLDAARYVSHQALPACFSAVEQIERTEQDASVRVLAVQAAASYHGQEDRAAALDASALTDLDPTVRIAAADALRTLHAVGSTGALKAALQTEGDDTVREHLREAIRVLGLPEPGH